MNDRVGGSPSEPAGVWEAGTWVVVLRDDALYRREIADPAARREAVRRLSAGETPRQVFGRLDGRLPLGRVRGVAWIPAAGMVLVRRGWWRDPWRLPFADADAGERLFQTLTARWPEAGAPVEGRIGPADLPMDPGLGLAVLLAFLGLVALAGGAVEGAGDAPMLGPARRMRWFAQIGETIGVAGVVAVGIAALAAGVYGLWRWRRNRPTKWEIRVR